MSERMFLYLVCCGMRIGRKSMIGCSAGTIVPLRGVSRLCCLLEAMWPLM